MVSYGSWPPSVSCTPMPCRLASRRSDSSWCTLDSKASTWSATPLRYSTTWLGSYPRKTVANVGWRIRPALGDGDRSVSHVPTIPPSRSEEWGSSPSGRRVAPSRHSALAASGQDLSAVLGDRDRVLEVRGQGPIGGHHGPVVGQDPGLPVAHGDHGMDRDHQAGPKLGPPAREPVIRDLGVLV